MNWRLLYAIPSWILYVLCNTLLILLGGIVVPIAAAAGAYEAVDSQDGVGNPRIDYHFTWPFMWIWDNKEDGIANDTYVKFESMFMKIVYWSCYRNPTNNLRYVPYISFNIDKEKVGYYGSLPMSADIRDYDKDDKTFYYFCWCGFYSNFRVHFRFITADIGWIELFGKKIIPYPTNFRKCVQRFWIGWKIYPEDSIYDVTGHRAESVGFGTQFKKCWPK